MDEQMAVIGQKMNKTLVYGLSADIILVIHMLFIVFVVIGFCLIIVGAVLRWSWIKNFWFRCLHLLAIGIVAAQAWIGQICPLTEWENSLREVAGGVTYTGTFVNYWLQRLIFYDFPQWVFTFAYTIFGAIVFITWVLVPPGLPRFLTRYRT
jgi:hypothetical protein